MKTTRQFLDAVWDVVTDVAVFVLLLHYISHYPYPQALLGVRYYVLGWCLLQLLKVTYYSTKEPIPPLRK